MYCLFITNSEIIDTPEGMVIEWFNGKDHFAEVRDSEDSYFCKWDDNIINVKYDEKHGYILPDGRNILDLEEVERIDNVESEISTYILERSGYERASCLNDIFDGKDKYIELFCNAFDETLLIETYDKTKILKSNYYDMQESILESKNFKNINDVLYFICNHFQDFYKIIIDYIGD